MLEINYWAVIAATVAAFVFSSVWYIVFGKARMKLLGNEQSATGDMRKVPTSKKLFEAFRTLVVVLVVAHLLALAGISGWLDAVQLEVRHSTAQ